MSGFAYRLTKGVATRVDLPKALEDGADLTWVHLSTNEARAQVYLRERAGLDAYVVDALTAQETRPRCEAFAHGALLNLRGRSDEEMTTADPLASLRIWAIKGRVFSVTRRPLVGVHHVQHAVENGEVHDPGDLIAAFASAITADLDPRVAALGDELDDCEERLGDTQAFQLRRAVTRVRVAAIGYRRFIDPQRQALTKLAELPGEWLEEDDRAHLLAAADRAARMAEEVEQIRERAALVHETLTDLRAEQLDRRSLLISAIAMIFLPLTFLTGLYGMNVKGLPGADSPYAFDAIALVCVLIALGVGGWFLRRHWFRE